MKRIITICALLLLTGFGCQRFGAGAGATTADTLVAEQDDWIKTHGTYKEVKPFVAQDGKTYKVNSVVQWNGFDKNGNAIEPTISYEIIVVNPKIEPPTNT